MLKKSTASECRDMDIEQFIAIIQQRPVLYNHNLKEYHNEDIVDQNWEEVANEMGVTGKFHIIIRIILGTCRLLAGHLKIK